MSWKPVILLARPDESNSSFSESSINSDINLHNPILQTQFEKVQKLEDKLAGYKTVVKQFPRLQASVAELQRKLEEQDKELAYYRASEAEQQEKILTLEKRLQDKKQGLPDLDASSQRLSHSHSSPSFEIIGQSPCSTSELFSQMQEVGTSSSHVAASETGDHSPRSSQRNIAASPDQHTYGPSLDHSPRSSHRNIAASPQQQPYGFSQAPRDVPFQSLKTENTVSANVVGPPKNPAVLSRVLSANVSTSEHNFNLPPWNQLNSYPASNRGTASVLAFVNVNKRPTWQMDPEAAANNPEPEKTSQLTGVRTSTQPRENLGDTVNSHKSSNMTSMTFNTSIQAGASETGTRPKEWKPLNTMTSQARSYSNEGLVRPSSYGTPQHADQIPIKTQEYATSGFISIFGTDLSKSDQTLRQKGLDVNIQAGENLPGSQNWGQNNGSPDLMTFPSLNTNSPSPVTEQNGITRPANPVYTQRTGVVTVPAEEQPCLTNQVESMVAILEKSDPPLGISDMLYTFAEAAKNMESQMNEYKALIQQQQIQIQQFQRFSEFTQGEETGKLREEISVLKSENETFLEFIGALRENRNSQVEPGLASVLATQNMTDPVRAHYPDSPLMKKIETLSNINTRLFTANKDWHSRWEVLRQQNQEEKADLEARVNSLDTMNKNLQENVTALEKELQIRSISLQDLAKASEIAEEEKSAMQRLNESLNSQLSALKTEVTDLTRSKRLLESELASLKDSSRSGSQTGNRDYQIEIGLLKQQLTVFAEDFEKEKKDRILAEKKVEKLKKERDQIKTTLETRLKKINVQLRTVEEDLRTKARQNADLLFQVDDLRLKLQREQRKNALATHSYNYQMPPPSYQGPMSMAYSSGMNGHNMGRSVNHHGSHASAGFSHQSSPEHLPGAWKCKHCTYINYPNRTVCDICGFTNTSGESLGMADSISGRNELQSRGEDRRWRNMEDIVVDCVPE